MGVIELVSFIAGFVFKLIATQQENLTKIAERAIQVNNNNSDQADRANDRIQSKAGMWLRRFIVLSILLSIIYFPAIAGFLDIPILKEIRTTVGGWLFGLVPERVIIDFIPLKGLLIQEDIVQFMKAIMVFYFGKSCVK